MNYTQSKDQLLSLIREGGKLDALAQIKLTALLSFPSMMAQLVHIMMQYIDAAMVGSLGAQASASIGLVSTTIWLFGSLCSAASVGFYVQVAHKIGAGDFAGARQVLRESFLSCILFSFLLCGIGVGISNHLPHWLGGGDDICGDASTYFMYFSLCLPFSMLNSLCSGMLRCSGNIHTPSILNVLMCLLDVLFNWLLIFPTCTLFGITFPGADLGVTGAVLGTALAYIICSLLMCYFTVVRSKELSLRQDCGTFIPQLRTLREGLHIAAPIAVEHIVLCGAQIVSTVIVAPLGTIAIAANSFGITVEALCYMPGYGMSDAATTLVGQSLGAGRRYLARSFGRITLGMGIAFMTLMAVVMYTASPALLSIMTPDVAVQQLTVEILRIEAFAEPMFAASIVCYGIFVGARDTLIPCTMNLTCIWLLRIIPAALLASHMGLQGVWIAMAVELTFRGIIFLIRFRGDSWLSHIDDKK
ncbi:MAG: MATE family efflux transporter [Bacteroidaceae bacterium]|jgi:putative MATE family efflux protein|nr:MATE family efflux transporter [Bacteroidaceae bacterium]MBO7168327.1 MATE family efflux transporter [Bacteroidaceae bacterium]MBQ5681595.1 MATE family efflux transporter [Bacteroidaceae bacterium]